MYQIAHSKKQIGAPKLIVRNRGSALIEVSTDILLLAGDLLATLSVGIGIALETPKNPNLCQKIAVGLVVGGVLIETLCSVGLFVHDEGVSQAQRETIASQQKQIISLIGSNRKLEQALDRQGKNIIAAGKRLDDISGRTDDLQHSLDDMGGQLGDLSKGVSGLQLGQQTLSKRQIAAEKRLGDVSAGIKDAGERLAALDKDLQNLADTLEPRELNIAPFARSGPLSPPAPHTSLYLSWAETLDKEPENFAKRWLGNDLANAGWNVVLLGQHAELFSGVVIVYKAPSSTGPLFSSAVATSAQAICRELVKQNFQAMVRRVEDEADPFWNPSVPNDALWVMVDSKENVFWVNRYLVAEGKKPIPTEKEIRAKFPLDTCES